MSAARTFSLDLLKIDKLSHREWPTKRSGVVDAGSWRHPSKLLPIDRRTNQSRNVARGYVGGPIAYGGFLASPYGLEERAAGWLYLINQER